MKKTEEQLKADHPVESKGGNRNDDERVREREEILKVRKQFLKRQI